MNINGYEIKPGANLYGADLYGANLRGANLYGADLYGANLRGADLYGADLYGANLRDAILRGANLRDAILRGADLRGANLYGANLYGADLRGADLYGAIGLFTNEDWLNTNLEKDGQRRFVCYKSFNEHYAPPDSWRIEEGSLIEENNLDEDRRNNCSSGINIGTLEYCQENSQYVIWKCAIPSDATIIVPYGTDGKFRCDKLILVERL